MKRKPLSRLARVRIFDRFKGICQLCDCKIVTGVAWEVDHIKPIWLGGADEEKNMQPVHEFCHAIKTGDEAPVRAKGNRVRARHLGIKKPSRFACSRNSPFKKKISGEVVRR